MTLLVLDTLADPGAWAAHEPSGAASALITVTAAPAPAAGLMIAAQANATGHYVQRTLLAPVNLDAFTDLLLTATADDETDAGTSGWELRLGGAGAAAIAAAANTWARLIPSPGGPLGSLVLVSTDDLVPDARTALTTLRLTRVTSSPGELQLASVAAMREEMLADVDAALMARLTGATAGGEGPVPAIVAEAGVAPPPMPYLRITNFDLRPAPERDPQTRSRTDYTPTGFTERPPRSAFDLLYELAVFADARAVEAGLIEHVMAELAPWTTLLVNGSPLIAEVTPIPAALGATRPDRVTVWVTVHASLQRAAIARPAVPPFAAIDVTTEALTGV